MKKAIAIMLVLIGLIIVGVLTGFVGIHYPRVIENQPLKDPVAISEVDGSTVTLADGRILELDSPDYDGINGGLISPGAEIDIEEIGYGEVIVWGVKPGWVCGTPWARPLRIPLIADDVYKNRREMIALAFFKESEIKAEQGTEEQLPDVAAANSDVKVRILAKQFSWHFHYPGEDGIFGASATGAITEDNGIGLDMRDPAAVDDFVTTELVLPCGTSVGLIITSADVIHALGHLQGDFEEDAIPGIEKTKALRTPALPRAGRLKCVQLCGAGHDDHHAPYRFVTESEYKDWISEQGKIARP